MAIRVEKRAVYICEDGVEFTDYMSAKLHENSAEIISNIMNISPQVSLEAADLILSFAYEIYKVLEPACVGRLPDA